MVATEFQKEMLNNCPISQPTDLKYESNRKQIKNEE